MVLGGEAFPHPLVFFGGGGEIDNSKQTDNTDIFQSSSLHKFSDSTVRIWFSLLYPGRGGGELRSLVVSPSVLEWFKSYLKGRYQYVRFGDVVSQSFPVDYGAP